VNGLIVVVGSLNQDLVVQLPRFPDRGETVTGDSLSLLCGGKGANQAYAAARLGARVAMVGQVGDDAAGDAQLRSLAAVGVDTRRIRRVPNLSTGSAIVAVEPGGHNRIIVVPGANGAFCPEALEESADLLAAAAVVLLQLEIPLPTVQAAVELARRGRARVLLDPAPARALPDALLGHVDYLTPNLSELATLSGRMLHDDSPADEIQHAAQELCRRGVAKVLVKVGSRGAQFVTGETSQAWPAFPVDPVDTTAAGDCFNGAFAAALAGGSSEVEAGRFAGAAAAISVTRPGAQSSMPALPEVERLLQSPRLS
jgi:ribokinase